MSRVGLANGLVQSDAIFIMPDSGGSAGQFLKYVGDHPDIPNAKLLGWQTVSGGGGGSSAWGDITGTLSNQTDLQSALDLRLNVGANQNLTLAELRQARRNQFEGSAPAFTYDGNNRVSTITYSDGSVKTFTYNGTTGLLERIDHVYSSPARTYRKDFTYSGTTLTSIAESLL